MRPIFLGSFYFLGWAVFLKEWLFLEKSPPRKGGSIKPSGLQERKTPAAMTRSGKGPARNREIFFAYSSGKDFFFTVLPRPLTIAGIMDRDMARVVPMPMSAVLHPCQRRLPLVLSSIVTSMRKRLGVTVRILSLRPGFKRPPRVELNRLKRTCGALTPDWS